MLTSLSVVEAWLRARLRLGERGAVVAQGLLVTVLVCLAIVAIVFWLVTSFHVSKK